MKKFKDYIDSTTYRDIDFCVEDFAKELDKSVMWAALFSRRSLITLDAVQLVVINELLRYLEDQRKSANIQKYTAKTIVQQFKDKEYETLCEYERKTDTRDETDRT